jgi:hypothetical protein
MAKLLSVTHRAAKMNVDKLVAAGILFEVPFGARKMYLASEVIAATE